MIVFFKNIYHKINFPILTVIIAALIGINTLFVPPIIGMANNGDFYRIMVSNNLYYLRNAPNHQPEYFNYFEPYYGISNLYNGNKKMIVSTQSLLIKPAIFLNNLLSKNKDIFNLEYLAFLLLVVHLIATYLIMKVFCSYLRFQSSRAILSFLYLFIFMDTGYIAYFNSFFGEAVNIPFFLLSVGFLLYIVRFNKIRWYTLTIFIGLSLIFFGAKQQLAPVGILIAFLILRIMYYKRTIDIRIVSIILFIILLSSSLFFYLSIKGDFQYINKYHALNRGIILDEPTPDNMLSSLGISTQYDILKNTNYFSPITQINLNDKNLENNYYKNLGVFNILKFYAMHPDDFFKMTSLSFKESYDIRPKELGNYTKLSGKPPVSKSYFWSGWSYLKANVFPKTLVASLAYIGIFFYFSIKRYRTFYKKKDDSGRLTEEIYYYVFLIGLSQVFISFIGAGDADIAKHNFMYNMAFDFLFLVCINNLLIKFERKKVLK